MQVPGAKQGLLIISSLVSSILSRLIHTHQMKWNKIVVIALACVFPLMLKAQEVGNSLPAWKEGYLDVHHINTGHGVSAFCILPDGTTMLVDAGEMNPHSERINSARNAKMHPDDSRPAHEWIAAY